jgi:hypothetical protein
VRFAPSQEKRKQCPPLPALVCGVVNVCDGVLSVCEGGKWGGYLHKIHGAFAELAQIALLKTLRNKIKR